MSGQELEVVFRRIDVAADIRYGWRRVLRKGLQAVEVAEHVIHLVFVRGVRPDLVGRRADVHSFRQGLQRRDVRRRHRRHRKTDV